MAVVCSCNLCLNKWILTCYFFNNASALTQILNQTFYKNICFAIDRSFMAWVHVYFRHLYWWWINIVEIQNRCTTMPIFVSSYQIFMTIITPTQLWYNWTLELWRKPIWQAQPLDRNLRNGRKVMKKPRCLVMSCRLMVRYIWFCLDTFNLNYKRFQQSNKCFH